MPVSQASVTVSTSATQLFGSSSSRRRFVVRNDSGVDVFIGGSGVTTTDGIKVATGTSYECVQQFPTDPSCKFPWYAVVAAATQPVKVLQVTG